MTCTKCKYILILRELTGELNSEIGTSYVMLSFLGNLDTNFTHIGISRSGFGNSSILSGRPYGGCAFLWRSDLSTQVQVLDTKSTRVCPFRLVTDICRLLLICAYLPYEAMSQ